MENTTSFLDCNIKNLICHKIGNHFRGDGVAFSDCFTQLEETSKTTFFKFIFRDFINNYQFFNLWNSVTLEFNDVYRFACNVFKNKDELVFRSQEIARHLYEHTNHPKISEGELYVVYLENCIIEGKRTDAIGLFKSEKKINTIFYDISKNAICQSLDQTNIGQLDRGCIIYNIEKEKGFAVQVINNLGRSTSDYWFSEFLGVRERRDNNFYTFQTINIISKYIKSEINTKFEISEIDRIKLLNKATTYFEDDDFFDLEDFTNEVFSQEDVINDFIGFKDTFCINCGLGTIPDHFNLFLPAVKSCLRLLAAKISIGGKIKMAVNETEGVLTEECDKEGKAYYKIYINQ